MGLQYIGQGSYRHKSTELPQIFSIRFISKLRALKEECILDSIADGLLSANLPPLNSRFDYELLG